MKNPQFNLFTTATIALLLFSFFSGNHAKTHVTPCSDGPLSQLASQFNISNCLKLGALSAEIGWSYTDEKQIDFLFTAKLSNQRSGYMAWGLNPYKAEMVGTRSLIIRRFENETMRTDTYDITGDTKRGCRLEPGPVDLFDLKEIRHQSFNSMGFLAMAVTLTIRSPLISISDLHVVWQVGPLKPDYEPSMHGKLLQNFDSCQTINLINGTSKSFARHQRRMRKAHGAMNIAGWGTILPIGIIIARYFRIYPVKMKYWQRFHVSSQMLGFTIGSIGWVLGICLSNTSKNYSFTTHRILGTTILAVALLQILALWLKPKKTDMFRQYWHIYHHLLGYALYGLIVFNIFHGARILSPNRRWKWAYVGILSILALIVLVMEMFTWIKFAMEKFEEKKKTKQGDTKEKEKEKDKEKESLPIERREGNEVGRTVGSITAGSNTRNIEIGRS